MSDRGAAGPGGFDEKTLKSAEFCRSKCLPCVRGREKGRGFLYRLMKVERLVCPKCKAYEKVYGVPAYMKPPESRGSRSI